MKDENQPCIYETIKEDKNSNKEEMLGQLN